MAKTEVKLNARSGVKVRCRAHRYYRDASTGKTHRGERGAPGTPSHRPGTGSFRVSERRWRRDAELPEADRLFERIDRPEASSHE